MSPSRFRAAAPPVPAAAAALLVGLAAALVGCGVKIEAPHATGLFSINAYYQDEQYPDADARQLAVANGLLYVVGVDGSLVKRNLNYVELERVEGLADPAAICVDAAGELVFVWEAGAGRLSAFRTSDLSSAGAAELPEVQRGTALAACATGLSELAPLAHTAVYISDPDSAVVHRYAWYEGGDMLALGILCRSEGQSVRSVHEPAGLLRDPVGDLLVCDADTLRNWVIHFDPTPDLTDVATNPDDPNPWRGLAILFDAPRCEPPAEDEYTLGDARACGQEWTGGPSDQPGAFDRPQALAVDGQARIFVADTGNDRIQLFLANGAFDLAYGDADKTPAPVSIGVVDERVSSTKVDYGAYVFMISADHDQVRRLISYDYYTYLNQEPPPQP